MTLTEVRALLTREKPPLPEEFNVVRYMDDVVERAISALVDRVDAHDHRRARRRLVERSDQWNFERTRR